MYPDVIRGMKAVNKTATHAPAANTAAEITLAADPDEIHDLRAIFASYSGTPASATLTITIGGTTTLLVSITAGGMVPFYFAREDGEGGLQSQKNEAVVITLSAGGAGVSGKLNAVYR